MADQENSVRPQREAKKRAAAAICEVSVGTAKKKKRVVLGELTNLSNYFSPPEKPVSCLVIRKEKTRVSNMVTIPNVGAKLNDPQLCGPYISDIYEYLHRTEVDPCKRPLPDYVQRVQSDVNANMRGDLVNWLVEVAEEYELVSDTLYFSVSYIDRFLSLKALSKQKLRLLGVSSMLIALKYEEKGPEVKNFFNITDNTYNKEEVVEMEADIFEVLEV